MIVGYKCVTDHTIQSPSQNLAWISHVVRNVQLHTGLDVGCCLCGVPGDFVPLVNACYGGKSPPLQCSETLCDCVTISHLREWCCRCVCGKHWHVTQLPSHLRRFCVMHLVCTSCHILGHAGCWQCMWYQPPGLVTASCALSGASIGLGALASQHP